MQPRLYLTLFLTELEPSSYKVALKDPKWVTAMNEEYSTLMKNQTWTLTPLPPNRQVIGCKYVFNIKQNPNGIV